MKWQLELEKELGPYLDGAWLIGKIQRNGTVDFGDSCANVFTRLFCKFIAEGRSDDLILEYEYACRLLNPAPGRWVRHPDPLMWYSRLDRISRDQMIPVICCWIAFQDYIRAKEYSDTHGLFFDGSGALNGDRHTQMPFYKKDITNFEVEGLIARALREEGMERPPSLIMKLGDFQMFLAAYFGLHRQNLDLRNFILPLLASHIAYPTTWGDRARASVNRDYLIHACQHWWGEKPHYKNLKVRLGEPPIHKWMIPAIEKIL